MQHQSPDPLPDAEGPRGPGSWSLRRKILLAFACLTAMVALCGAAGLLFFERIAASAAILSDVSSPLLIESMALQRNADRMRAVLSENLESHDAGEEQLAALAALGAEGQAHTVNLKRLSGGIGLLPQFEAVEQLQRDFSATLNQIVQARTRRAWANTEIQETYAKVNAATAALESGFFEILHEKGETTAVLARSQLAADLVHKMAMAHDFSAKAHTIGSGLDLERLEEAVERFMSGLAASVDEIRPLMQTADDQAMLARIDTAMADLKSGLIGHDGLIGKKRDLIAANAIFTARSKRLSEIEWRYADVLTGIASAVRQQNELSSARIASTIGEGRIAVIMLIGVSTLLAMAAAFFLTLSILRPLERLTSHMQRVREHGELIEIADEPLLASTDELGELSRVFNGMIHELADARRTLIATSEAEVNKQVDRLRAAIGHMSQGLVMFDHNQRLIISNDRYAEIYGIPPENIYSGMHMRQVLEQRIPSESFHGDAATYVARMTCTMKENWPSETVVELNNGRIINILRRPLKKGGWVATFEDITERRQIEAKIAHMAHHDVLTNLPNRVLFRDRMEECIIHVARGERIAVLCLDLDHFKSVNDMLGHSIGDALLRSVTERLLDCVREVDTIARLGGDEFAVIQRGIDGPQDSSTLAQRIIDRMAAPFILDSHQVVIGTSIGISMPPNDGMNADELLKKADLALYRAKGDGRNTYRFFEPDMGANMQSRRKLELELRNALSAGQFELHYQPLVNLDSGKIASFEALLRWHHPERGTVQPGEFIPLAEEIGLIVPLGEWVIHQACRDASAWPENVHVSVNLSPVQFKSRKLIDTIALALTNSRLNPTRLELEITESVLLYENEATLATLRQIKSLGVKISLDDFGTGYSSLSYLRSFPFDRIKIDRSFIRDLAESEDCVAIVRAVTGLGASLGMATIAEGVETAEQLEKLRLEGCTEVQGFLLGKPKSLAEMGPLLDELRRHAAA